MLFINPLMNDDIQLNFRYSSIYFNSLYIRSLARLSFFLTSYARRYAHKICDTMCKSTVLSMQ